MRLRVTAVVGLVAGVAMSGAASASASASGAPAPVQKWRITSFTGLPVNDSLNGLAVTGRRSAWAVGSVKKDETGLSEPLVYRWNGETWSRTELPATVDSGLDAVDAVSDDNVWAIGTGGDSESRFTKAFHWDGRSWRSSVIKQGEGFSTYVQAVSASDVWVAVNDDLQHWNGRTWSSVSLPGLDTGRLRGLEFTSARNGWAVGDSGGRPVAWHWDGKIWKTTRMPTGIEANARLLSVLQLSSKNVWAVGTITRLVEGDVEYTPFALRWNGSTWRAVEAPPNKVSLSGLAADGRGGIWTQGDSETEPGKLLNHRSGHWTVVEKPTTEDGAFQAFHMANIPGTPELLGATWLTRDHGPESDRQEGAFFTAR